MRIGWQREVPATFEGRGGSWQGGGNFGKVRGPKQEREKNTKGKGAGSPTYRLEREKGLPFFFFPGKKTVGRGGGGSLTKRKWGRKCV